jgi:hypothetical protein
MEPWKPDYLRRDGSFSRAVTLEEQLDWLDWIAEDPKMWAPPRRGMPLAHEAPDPPWMIRARAEIARQDRTPIKILPDKWYGHRHQFYAWYVVHLAQAVKRELEIQVRAREARVFHLRPKKDDWILRIEIDYDLPRPFTIEGVVDPGDFRTAPFFREINVSFISKSFLPGELTEKNGELVGQEDWCIMLNEWGGREARGAGGQEPGAGEGPGLLDLLHKFIPPPLWWRGYCSPFKIPYSMWYGPGPLPEWAEKRLFHAKSTEWPWLPDGEARERMKVWAARKWKNRKGWWKDGVNRRVTRPSITDVRSARGVWRKPYSRSAKKIHGKKSAWTPSLQVPGRAHQIAAFCEAGPFKVSAAEANGSTPRLVVSDQKGGEVSNLPSPWPKWKRRRALKAKPKRCSKRAIEINQVLNRYLAAMPSLTVTPLKARARRYRVQARLIPMGSKIYLAELFEFETELQRALKYYSRRWCQMPKSKRVAVRDKVRRAKGKKRVKGELH